MSDMPTGQHGPGRYEIRIKGHLEVRWVTWFDGLSVTNDSNGTTVIHGVVADQAALHGLLQKVRDAGLPLVSVTQVGNSAATRPAVSADATPNNTKDKR